MTSEEIFIELQTKPLTDIRTDASFLVTPKIRVPRIHIRKVIRLKTINICDYTIFVECEFVACKFDPVTTLTRPILVGCSLWDCANVESIVMRDGKSAMNFCKVHDR